MHQHKTVGNDVRLDCLGAGKQRIRQLDGKTLVAGCRIHACKGKAGRGVVAQNKLYRFQEPDGVVLAMNPLHSGSIGSPGCLTCFFSA